MADPWVLALFSRSQAQGSKSSIMSSVTWVIGIVATLLGVLVKFGGLPQWLIVVLVLTFILVFVAALIFAGYVYLWAAKNNSDLLRSETFHIQKIAIEKQKFGDSLSGEILEDEPLLLSHTTPKLPAKTIKVIDAEEKKGAES